MKSFLRALSSLLYLYIFESFLIFIIDKFFNLKKKKSYLLINKKKNERVFIFGSGYSLNNITQYEWDLMEKSGDTFSFNDFIKSRFIRIDYHLIREFEAKRVITAKLDRNGRFSTIYNFKILKEYFNSILENPYMENTGLIYLTDMKAGQSILWRWLYGKNFLNLGSYSNHFNRKIAWPPSENLEKIPHGNASLIDCINLSYLLGYKEIVLVGVDLYDRRYFYLDYNETRAFDEDRGFNSKDLHGTSKGLIRHIEKWSHFLKNKGVHLSVYNPDSLLNEVIPVFKFKKDI